MCVHIPRASLLTQCVDAHAGSDQGLLLPPSLTHRPPLLDSVTASVMNGTRPGRAEHEAARDAIGHELALIGVPPPTTLDGFQPANADEMKNFMISVGLSPEQVEQIAVKLKSSLSITSMVQFGSWFSEHPLKDWFHSYVEWRNNAPLFVGMLWALQSCTKMTLAKEKSEEQLKVDDKIPMDPLLNRSLNETWQKIYKVPLAPSQS